MTTWRKSSRSRQEGGNCVELNTQDVSQIRDSKNPAGPVLSIGRTELTQLLVTIKTGKYDR